jgi:hypothetical protein
MHALYHVWFYNLGEVGKGWVEAQDPKLFCVGLISSFPTDMPTDLKQVTLTGPSFPFFIWRVGIKYYFLGSIVLMF